MSDTASFRYTDPGTYYPQATCGGYTATATDPVVVDPALPAPASITAVADGADTVNVTWSAVTGADSYVVTYWPTATPTDTSTVTSTELTAAVTGLDANTEYGFSVHAVDASGAAGAESTTATATTGETQLPTPTGLATGTITDTTVAVTWTAVAGANSYLVSWALQSSPGTPIDTATVVAASHTVTGLTADTDYVITVVARATGSADSDPATVNASTLPQLATPTGVAASNQTAVGADIAWSAVSGADGYSISWALAATPNTVIDSDTAASGPYTITGLSASTDYIASVVATDSTGAAADSDAGTATFTTTAS